MKFINKLTYVAWAALLSSACEVPQGLAPTPAGSGPMIVFDLSARPYPDIPFPSDLATRPDPSSATGKRVNISQLAPTMLEQSVRREFDKLDGFGTLSPISLAFDAPLAVADFLSVRHDDGDRSDDLVMLLVVDPDSEFFGEAAYLDLGRGYYPITVERSDRYFSSDSRSQSSNLLFDTVDEDLNHNGVLDAGEDTNADGLLNKPNVKPGSAGDPYRDLLDFYELATNTLILRPVTPLRERTRYAVVISDRVRGLQGEPIRSPFPYIHHLNQTDDLAALPEALARHGRDISEVAFAWSFTTMSIFAEMDALRAGLRGEGVFARLQEEYSPDAYLHQLNDHPDTGDQRRYLVPADDLTSILTVAWDFLAPLLQLNPKSLNALLDSYLFVDYFVSGSFKTPYLLATPSETWDLDLHSGHLTAGEQEVTFWLSVPKPNQHTLADGTVVRNEPPFPVVIFVHGSASNRLETLGFAGAWARHGFAVLGIDAVGHGLALDRISPDLKQLILGLVESLDLKGVFRAFNTDRARDLNDDGLLDPGADFWSANLFRTRDKVRQTVLDVMQAVRLLQSFDGVRTFATREDPRIERQLGLIGELNDCRGIANKEKRIAFSGDVDCDGKPDLAGDFNGDGIVDLGGPDQLIVASGNSLGAIATVVAAGAEPDIQRVVPISGGGGIGDISVRTILDGVVQAVFLKLFGPLIVSVPYAPIRDEPTPYYDDQVRRYLRTKYLPERINGIWAASDPQHLGQDYSQGAIITSVWIKLLTVPSPGEVLLVDYDAIAQPEKDLIPPGPLFLRLQYDLYDVDQELHLTISDRLDLQAGDLVRLTNLANGESKTIAAGPYGRFRIAVAADCVEDLQGLDLATKREILLACDHLDLELLHPDGSLKQRIDSLTEKLHWRGVEFAPGDPLLSLGEGFGLARNTPDFRRMIQLSQLTFDSTDPANWAPRIKDRMLQVLTVGDMVVPINAGITLARAAGFLRFDPLSPDPVPADKRRQDARTEHQVLMDYWVLEGLEGLDRFPETPFTLADPDNLDRDLDDFHAPTPAEPLRATRYDSQGRPIAGLRFAYMERFGHHGVNVPSPFKTFDIDSFFINMMGHYLKEGVISDDLCLEDNSCDFIPAKLVPISARE